MWNLSPVLYFSLGRSILIFLNLLRFPILTVSLGWMYLHKNVEIEINFLPGRNAKPGS